MEEDEASTGSQTHGQTQAVVRGPLPFVRCHSIPVRMQEMGVSNSPSEEFHYGSLPQTLSLKTLNTTNAAAPSVITMKLVQGVMYKVSSKLRSWKTRANEEIFLFASKGLWYNFKMRTEHYSIEMCLCFPEEASGGVIDFLFVSCNEKSQAIVKSMNEKFSKLSDSVGVAPVVRQIKRILYFMRNEGENDEEDPKGIFHIGSRRVSSSNSTDSSSVLPTIVGNDNMISTESPGSRLGRPKTCGCYFSAGAGFFCSFSSFKIEQAQTLLFDSSDSVSRGSPSFSPLRRNSSSPGVLPIRHSYSDSDVTKSPQTGPSSFPRSYEALVARATTVSQTKSPNFMGMIPEPDFSLEKRSSLLSDISSGGGSSQQTPGFGPFLGPRKLSNLSLTEDSSNDNRRFSFVGEVSVEIKRWDFINLKRSVVVYILAKCFPHVKPAKSRSFYLSAGVRHFMNTLHAKFVSYSSWTDEILQMKSARFALIKLFKDAAGQLTSGNTCFVYLILLVSNFCHSRGREIFATSTNFPVITIMAIGKSLLNYMEKWELNEYTNTLRGCVRAFLSSYASDEIDRTVVLPSMRELHCCICFQPIVGSNEAIAMPCGHHYIHHAEFEEVSDMFDGKCPDCGFCPQALKKSSTKAALFSS